MDGFKYNNPIKLIKKGKMLQSNWSNRTYFDTLLSGRESYYLTKRYLNV
jgi:hypothetical protein